MRLFDSWLPMVLSLLSGTVSAVRVFESSSLDSCQSNSSFSASLFNIIFTPDNRTLSVNVNGDSSVSGNVTFKVQASIYGYTFLTETLDPCTVEGLSSLCPLSTIQTGFDTTYSNISTSFISSIPSIAYTIPDLDAIVTVQMYLKNEPTIRQACVKLRISNGKTVHQVGVRWGTAVVAIAGLLASAIVSALGFANTAAHMMLYTLSLFSYFQAVAIIGLCAVPLPPVVQSWTQDMSWSVGIIKVGFLQKMARWYLLATGGTPETILTSLSTKSVQVSKRALGQGPSLLHKRVSITTTESGEYVVTGIQRAAFIENIEPTNLFFTALTFYCIFVIFVLALVVIFKGSCELAIRMRWIKTESPLFHIVRNEWRCRFKGIIFRLILIGYPPMMIYSLWECTQNDSPAEIFLAVIFFFGMIVALAWATFKVFSVAKRSESIHSTPVHLLYADATVLNKWGFLYTQFRASAYRYIAPLLIYILVKAAFVGLGQKSGLTQAIALTIIEAAALIGASVYRPWMDKSTNSIMISICVINFLNAIFLLIFTNVFNGPGLLIGVIGVIFFIMNVVFALVLLLVVLISVVMSFIRSNPETHYKPLSDNRESFIKSQTVLSTELEALGFTARRESRHMKSEKDLRGLHSHGFVRQQHDDAYSNLPPRENNNNLEEFNSTSLTPRTPGGQAGPLPL